MKKIILLSLIAISTIAFNACDNSNAVTSSQNEKITFYDVPLVCNAHTAIGCGSRAKPALLEMEKNPAVKEAWLNRAGTVYAIVWRDEEHTRKVAKPIFDKYEIDFTALDGTDAKENLESFRKEKLWYRSADVDKLSIEEAEHIATTLMDFSLKKKLLTPEESDKLKPKIESYFKTELVKVRTPEQLYDDSENKFRTDLTAIASNVIGEERTENIIEEYYKEREKQAEVEGGCCQKNHSDKCCSKKGKEKISLQSEITCPSCRHKKIETMPTDVCQFSYQCESCKAVLKSKEGDCCVFCSYGSKPCPSKQEEKMQG